ncbi:MAG: hypothetical protein R3F43_25580 [bacterium]
MDRLAAEMAEKGFDRRFPVKVDGDMVVDGHHRVMAARKAGVDVVTTPGTASNASKSNALRSFDDIMVELVDWYE